MLGTLGGEPMPYAYLSGHRSMMRRGPSTGATWGDAPYAPPPPGYASPKPGTTPAAPPGGSNSDLAETLQSYAPTLQTLIEWASGKWNKEERTAKYLAQAQAEQGGGGFGGIAKANAGPLGLPWVLWLIGGGVGVYLLARK